MLKKIKTLALGCAVISALSVQSFAASSLTLTPQVPIGSFLSEGEQIIYDFTPSQTGMYALKSLGSVDTYATLYDDQNVAMVSNDDGYNDLNFAISAWLTAGKTYTLHVSGVGYSEYGYVQCVAMPASSPLKSAEMSPMAKDLVLGLSQDLKLTRGSDKLYHVKPAVSGAYTFYTEGSVDTFGTLLDANFEAINSDDDGNGYDTNFQITTNLEAEKDYYLLIGALDYYESGDSTVYFDEGSDLNDVYTDVWTLTPTALKTGVGYSDAMTSNEAIFSFTPDETSVYAIYSDSDIDTYGVMYDSERSYMLENDDIYTDDGDFRIDITLEAGQTYYIIASGYTYDDVGPYTLMVDKAENAPAVDVERLLENEIKTLFDDAEPIEVGKVQSSTLETGDNVVYTFTPDVDGDYIIESVSDVDLYGFVYDSETRYIGFNDDISEDDFDFSMTLSLKAGQTYYIFLGGYTDDDYGTYSVSIQKYQEN